MYCKNLFHVVSYQTKIIRLMWLPCRSHHCFWFLFFSKQQDNLNWISCDHQVDIRILSHHLLQLDMAGLLQVVIMLDVSWLLLSTSLFQQLAAVLQFANTKPSSDFCLINQDLMYLIKPAGLIVNLHQVCRFRLCKYCNLSCSNSVLISF